MTRLVAAIGTKLSEGNRLAYANAAMATVLLGYYWPIAAIWFAIVGLTGVALVSLLRLARA
jgi:hypothetical protein